MQMWRPHSAPARISMPEGTVQWNNPLYLVTGPSSVLALTCSRKVAKRPMTCFRSSSSAVRQYSSVSNPARAARRDQGSSTISSGLSCSLTERSTFHSSSERDTVFVSCMGAGFRSFFSGPESPAAHVPHPQRKDAACRQQNITVCADMAFQDAAVFLRRTAPHGTLTVVQSL